MHDSNSTGARTALLVVALAVAAGLLLAGAVMPAAAAEGADGTGNETTNGDETIDDTNNEATETCEADINSIDVHTADSIVDGADDPARVGVSVSTSFTNECPVKVQVDFDIPNNMYYQGTSAGSSGQGLQTEVFEVPPGESEDFTTTMYANQPGDRTVTADVEYFPEGQPEDARSLSNMMLTFDVQDPVPEEEWPDEPVNGEVNQPDDDTEEETVGDNDNSGGDGSSNNDDDGLLDALADDLVAVLAIIGIISIGTIVAWKGRDMLFIKS